MAVPHDQRFHNYLLYTGAFHRVRLLRAGAAEVFNMGYLGRKDRSAEGIDPKRFHHIDDVAERVAGRGLVVRNGDGGVAPVLHQVPTRSAALPSCCPAARSTGLRLC